MNLKNFSWHAKALMSDTDIPYLLRVCHKSYPITGRVSGLGEWTSGGKTPSRFLGRFQISDGVIGPTIALKKWAHETGIDALSQIRFHNYMGRVVLNEKGDDLYNFKINSDQIRIAAKLKVKDDRVWGRRTTQFPQSIVKDSSQLKWLLHYVGAAAWIDLDFKIAGSLISPRLMWLNSEFKKKVDSKLAPWMKDRLSSEIEKKLLVNA